MTITVISVGGSLIVPEEIDIEFLKSFKQLILEQVEKGERFVLITGGGKTCRKYQKAASELAEVSQDNLDWIGIRTTRLNAHLLQLMFEDKVEDKLIGDPEEKIDFNKNIIIGAGWEPGWSSDIDAVMVAKNLGATKVINLSNVDYVYNKDPNKYDDAKPIEKASWEEFRNIIPKEWTPGLNVPFDPSAAKYADENNLEVAIMNGNNLENLKNYLEGNDFKGTIIKP